MILFQIILHLLCAKGLSKNSWWNTDDFVSIFQLFALFMRKSHSGKENQKHGWLYIILPIFFAFLCAKTNLLNYFKGSSTNNVTETRILFQFNVPTILHLLCATAILLNNLRGRPQMTPRHKGGRCIKTRMIFFKFTNYFASFMRKRTFEK